MSELPLILGLTFKSRLLADSARFWWAVTLGDISGDYDVFRLPGHEAKQYYLLEKLIH